MIYSINAGELRHIISIERYKEGIDDNGIAHETWSLLLNSRAKIINLKMEEFLIAQGQGLSEVKTFFIRHPRVQISMKDRILWNDTYYEIIAIDDVQNRGMYLSLKGKVAE